MKQHLAIGQRADRRRVRRVGTRLGGNKINGAVRRMRTSLCVA